MLIENKNVELNNRYWIVDESAPINKELFQFKFEYKDEALERWDWTIFNNKTEAVNYRKYLNKK